MHLAIFYPVALASGVNDAQIGYATGRDPVSTGWWGVGLPIMWDVADGQVYYSQSTRAWPDSQGVIWDRMRQTAVDVFNP